MEIEEVTYPMGAVARLTGLTPDVLRAWERRYRAVEPLRTEGGTRRYRASDLERLRLVKAAVDAGHRIGDVARLEREALERIVEAPEEPAVPLEAVLGALDRLDAAEAERLISAQLSALGPMRFASAFALPLLAAIGDAWERRRLCVASEHLGSALLRSLLGTALRPTRAHRHGPRVVFGTLPGERHEIGLLIAALTAMGAGANPVYLGPELPADELLRAVEISDAAAIAISLVALPEGEALAGIEALRRELPENVELWVGGQLAGRLALPDGVHPIVSLTDLEHRVEQLGAGASVA